MNTGNIYVLSNINSISLPRKWIKVIVLTLSFNVALVILHIFVNHDMEANAVQKCAYLTCSHSPLCTTQNTSCCAYILKQTLYFLDTFFQKHHIAYVILSGTALGAVRNQTVIPWTSDLDIGIFDKKLLYSQKIRDELQKYGYYLVEARGLTRLCIHSNALDETLLITEAVDHIPAKSMYDIAAYVDLFYAKLQPTVTNDAITPTYYIECTEPRLLSISFKTRVNIDNRSFPTVDDVEEHLVTQYGPNYMHPEIS